MLFNTPRVTMWITPFGEVSNFIQETAREWNDPYLSLEGPDKSLSLQKRSSKPTFKPTSKPPKRPPVKPGDIPTFGEGLVPLRTDIIDPTLNCSVSQDPEKWWLIHKLCYFLSKCRALRARPLIKRKLCSTNRGSIFAALLRPIT